MAELNPISQLLENRKQTGTTAGVGVSESQTVETIPADVSLLVESILETGEAAKDANTKLVEEMTSFALQDEVQQERISDANRAIKGQEAKATLETQQAVRDVFEAGGGVDLLTSLATKQGEQMRVAMQQADDVVALETMTMDEDGVIGFLGSRLLLPQERRQSATANAQVEDTAKMIETVKATTTNVASTMATVAELRTEATVDAIDEQMEATAAADRIARASKLAQTNAKAINETFKLTQQEVQSIVSLKTEERLALAARAQSAAIEYEKQTDEEIARIYNIHADNVEANRVTPKQVAGARKIGGDELENLKVGYRKGGKLLVKAPQKYVAIGNNTAEAMLSAVQANSADVATDNNRNRFLSDISDTVQAALAAQNVDITKIDQEQYDKLINAEVERVAKQDKEVIPAGGTSLYSAPPMDVIKQSEAVQATPLWQKVLAPLDLKGEIDERQVFTLGVAAVADKTVNIQEFVDGIRTIFGFSVAYNNATNQYEKYHLEGQDSYPVMLGPGGEAKGVFGFLAPKKTKTDLNDPTSIRNTAARYFWTLKGRPSLFDESPEPEVPDTSIIPTAGAL